MNRYVHSSLEAKLLALDEQVRQRASLAFVGYSLGMAGALLLYVFFPFSLSRIGSVVMLVAFAHMLWKVREASSEALKRPPQPHEQPFQEDLDLIEGQIRLIESMLYHLPFLVGANLFWMGLPGTGSAESKAWQDCWFLLVSVILFGGLYVSNQQTVRKELRPLRQEVQRAVLQQATAGPAA